MRTCGARSRLCQATLGPSRPHGPRYNKSFAVNLANNPGGHARWRSVERDSALAQADDARGVGQGGLELVLAHNEREPLRAVDRPEDVHDAAGERGIEARGGLVGQDDRGPLRERARDRDALLLAAREGVGAAVREGSEPDLRQGRTRQRVGASPEGAW